MTLRVVAVGPLATIQDPGRPGHGAIGVPRGGAVDRGALTMAHRLVGNPDDAAPGAAVDDGAVVEARPAAISTRGSLADTTGVGSSRMSVNTSIGEAPPTRSGDGFSVRVAAVMPVILARERSAYGTSPRSRITK